MGKWDRKTVVRFLDERVGDMTAESVRNATKGMAERERNKYLGKVTQKS